MNRISSHSTPAHSRPAHRAQTRLVHWLLLAEVTLFTLIAGGAGFAIAWFVVNDGSTLRIYPEASGPQSAPAFDKVEANGQNACIDRGFAPGVASHTTCISAH